MSKHRLMPAQSFALASVRSFNANTNALRYLLEGADVQLLRKRYLMPASDFKKARARHDQSERATSWRKRLLIFMPLGVAVALVAVYAVPSMNGLDQVAGSLSPTPAARSVQHEIQSERDRCSKTSAEALEAIDFGGVQARLPNSSCGVLAITTLTQAGERLRSFEWRK